MFKSKVQHVKKDQWQPTRENITKDVLGKNLLPSKITEVKAVLTRVTPGGEFRKHTDEYHHIFYFLKGRGIGWLGKKQYQIAPNTLVQVPKGTIHGYKNTSNKVMLLITFNLPKKT